MDKRFLKFFCQCLGSFGDEAGLRTLVIAGKFTHWERPLRLMGYFLILFVHPRFSFRLTSIYSPNQTFFYDFRR